MRAVVRFVLLAVLVAAVMHTVVLPFWDMLIRIAWEYTR